MSNLQINHVPNSHRSLARGLIILENVSPIPHFHWAVKGTFLHKTQLYTSVFTIIFSTKVEVTKGTDALHTHDDNVVKRKKTTQNLQILQVLNPDFFNFHNIFVWADTYWLKFKLTQVINSTCSYLFMLSIFSLKLEMTNCDEIVSKLRLENSSTRQTMTAIPGSSPKI